MTTSKEVELSVVERDTIYNALRTQLFPRGGP